MYICGFVYSEKALIFEKFRGKEQGAFFQIWRERTEHSKYRAGKNQELSKNMQERLILQPLLLVSSAGAAETRAAPAVATAGAVQSRPAPDVANSRSGAIVDRSCCDHSRSGAITARSCCDHCRSGSGPLLLHVPLQKPTSGNTCQNRSYRSI